MADVRCLDGTVLGVHPVPVVDRDRSTYEITLRLTRDAAPYAEVGERCGYFLAATAARLAAARADGSPESRSWPNVEDRFPISSCEGGLRAWAADAGVDPDEAWASLERYLPRDRDLFAFRHRDPDDIGGTGELRCSLHTHKRRIGGPRVAGAGGRWELRQRAVLEAWGASGIGVRAVLSSDELDVFLRALLGEAADVGARYELSEAVTGLSRPAG